jgi:hypothetical protein
VAKKLRDVRFDDIPDNDKPNMITDIPTDDKLINDVLSGGYNVQPIPFPNSLFDDNIVVLYEVGITKIDILLILGYVISGIHKYIGTKVFPGLPYNPGITKKKIISNPCKVIKRL